MLDVIISHFIDHTLEYVHAEHKEVLYLNVLS